MAKPSDRLNSPSQDKARDSSITCVDQVTSQNENLRSMVEELGEKRRNLRRLRERQEILQKDTLLRLNRATNQQHELLLDFQSAAFEREKVQRTLLAYQQLNVTNDCFHIWHDGPFGTINGLRLGLEGPPPLESPASAPANIGNIVELRRYLYFSGHTDSLQSKTANAVSTKVPWKEVNAALGQVALLLSTLERKPNCGLKFRYEIKAAGSTSKIGVRQSLTSSLTLYNLYYTDDSFQFFGKRNFNTAIQYLVQCVADTAEIIRSRDRTIILPHVIEHTAGRGGSAELTIGGLSVSYGSDDVEWTRAMKYLLTDIKQIMIFKPFSLWS